MRKNVYRVLVSVVLVGVLLSWQGYVRSERAAAASARMYKDLKNIVKQGTSQEEGQAAVDVDPVREEPAICLPSEDEAVREEPVMLEEYRSLYEINGDMAGWLRVSEKIDYPLVQPEEPDYYLRRDFSGKESKAGTLFLSPESRLGKRGISVVYGHKMRDKSMFGTLDGYLKEEYREAHSVISVDTLYEKCQYELVAVFRARVGVPEGDFAFYDYKGDVTEAQFAEYLSGVKGLAEYEDLGSVGYGDSLLELVTCSYHTNNGRLVVLFRKVEGGEPSHPETEAVMLGG